MLDPLSMMFLASNLQQPGQEALPGLSPMGAPAPAAGTSPAGNMMNALKGVQAPDAAKPQFSGGVSGSGLPYLQQVNDFTAPMLQATGGAQGAPTLPTLAQLFAGAGGR